MFSLQGHGPSAPIGPVDEHVVDQFHVFPFSSDEAFQQGLAGILAHDSTNQLSDDEKSELILRTRVFYFNRVTGHDISLADARTCHPADVSSAQDRIGCNQTLCGTSPGETRTLTFAELKRLIEEGKTDDIPNNKTIPNTLNDGVLSQSTVPPRKKPWEVERQS